MKKKKKSLQTPEDLSESEVDAKIARLKELQQQLYLQENLPHLFGNKMYKWQQDFFYTKNKSAYICSGNQVGKTEIQGRKLINLATIGNQWSDWFSTKPDCFWYLLPSKEMIEAVIDLKWKPQLLPRGIFQQDSRYGWEFKKAHGSYSYLQFNNGMRIYLKSYSMGGEVLQSGTLDYVAFDEELPWELYEELNSRRRFRDGYLCGVMTPTKGQEEWRRVFEERGEKEIFPGAFKKQVSLFECQKFVDGTPSMWTDDKIQKVVQSCSTDQEIQKRVYGRFVKSDGLMVPGFSITRNVKPAHPINFSGGYVYSAVDPGAGKVSRSTHPSAITFVYVNSDFSMGRVFRAWRSPNGMITEARDILQKYVEMRSTITMTGEYYDWKNRDFEIVANRAGLAFQKAEKGRDFGYQLLNLLFKTGTLQIFDLEETQPLIQELMSLSVDTAKNVAEDDALDSLRYAISSIPWNYEKITDLPIPTDAENKEENKIVDLRTNPPQDMINTSELEQEFEFWNSHYDGGSD